jgi:putative transposase
LRSICLLFNAKSFSLFIKVNDSILFEKGIKNFFISYSKAINKRYDRVGSLFQGRYKVSEINSDSYYTTIITYIHQNPIVAGIVTKLEEYKYSSYAAYLSDKNPLVNKKEVLEWFGGLDGFIEHYLSVINEFEISKRLKL